MNDFVQLNRDGGVATLIIDNPPVNIVDSAVLAALVSALDELEADPSLAISESIKDLKSLAKKDYDLISFEPKGELYIDGNGESKGFGKKSKGGVIAGLSNKTILTGNDF